MSVRTLTIPSHPQISSLRNENAQKSISLLNHSIRTVITSACVYAIFGVQVAAICIIAELIFSAFRLIPKDQWFSREYFFQHTKVAFGIYYPMFKIHLICGIIVKALRLEPKQQVAKVIKNAFSQRFWVGAKMFAIATLIGPIFEEIIFRGFLQEKIKLFQAHILKVDENSSLQKTMRVFLQAVIFGLCHWHRLHTLSLNVFFIIILSIGGMALGEIKEQQNSLVGSMAFHSIHNTCVTTRLFFGG